MVAFWCLGKGTQGFLQLEDALKSGQLNMLLSDYVSSCTSNFNIRA